MGKMPSVLSCDIGNSAIHFAHIKGKDVAGTRSLRIGKLTGLGKAMGELWSQMPDPKRIVACSVSPAGLKALEAAVDESIAEEVLVIGRDLPLPLPTDLDHPEGVGVDRLCCAAAAFDQLGVACVVADFGTAITVDCVSDEGVFLGGSIIPGLQMGAESLAANTALLPKVKPTDPKWVFGKDTHQAIAGGLVFAARGALRELVETYATELGHWPTVIITGGDAKLICPDPNTSELIQARVDDLTLRGVAIAYYRTLVKNNQRLMSND